jgi:hypothetical protein
MPHCKSCNATISAEQAAASLFDLRFLPGPDGRPVHRSFAKYRAEGVGPLCEKCLAKQKTLPRRK